MMFLPTGNENMTTCRLMTTLLQAAGLAASAAVVAAAVVANAGEADRFMTTAGAATAPAGFVEFCREEPAECDDRTGRGLLVKLDDARWLDLIVVNRSVNQRIKPATDREMHGVEERWSLPTDRGDCEDYVLLKRHELKRRGWPASALLVTVVRDELGEGHAVLTVRTDRGELVLDNKVDVIRPWYETSYTYVKRQATVDAGLWLRIDDRADQPVSSIRR
jgi:predicted transglutaminase-like cysteine proteinase